MNQVPHRPRVSQQDHFEFFSNIRGDIRSSRCTTGVVDSGDKWRKKIQKGKFLLFLLDTFG
jgi:hypothetical protein